MACAAWVKSLKWAAVGDTFILMAGCSEGSVRLYAAQQSSLAALPDMLPASSAHAAGEISPEPLSSMPAQQSGAADQLDRGQGRASEQVGNSSALPARRAHGVGTSGDTAPFVRLMGVIVQPDQRSVTCMDFRASHNAATGDSTLWILNEQHPQDQCLEMCVLMLASHCVCVLCAHVGESFLYAAAGKSSGRLFLWKVTLRQAEPGSCPTLGSSTSACIEEGHGSMDVSGVCWTRCPPPAAADSADAPAALLCSSGVDGRVRAWQWNGGQVSLGSSIGLC
jgi:WD40 repeat protein